MTGNRSITFRIHYPPKAQRSQWNRDYSLNAIYAGKHWSVRKKDSVLWHALVLSELRKQKVPIQIFDKPVEVRFYHHDRLDIDNHAYMEKMIVDALKGKLLRDDNRKNYIRKISEYHDDDCILVRIREV